MRRLIGMAGALTLVLGCVGSESMPGGMGQGHPDLAVAPDGLTVATGGADHVVAVWDMPE